MRSGIGALGVLSFDQGQFPQHGNPISEWMDFRAWLIGPVHRDFRDMIAPLPRDVEQFEIEAVAVDGGDAKEVLRDRPAEQLEAALCIGDSFEAAQPHDPIEQVTQERSVQAGLDRIARQSGGKCARSDGQVRAGCQGLFEPGELLNRGRAIRVGKELQPSDGFPHSSPYSGPLSLASRIPEQSNFRS